MKKIASPVVSGTERLERTEARHVAIACRASCHQVGLSGVEPLTSRLSGVRSNHLSYRPGTPNLAAQGGLRYSKHQNAYGSWCV
jgi:hypothetical protein